MNNSNVTYATTIQQYPPSRKRNTIHSPSYQVTERCALLYQKYENVVFRKCLFMLKNEAWAEDATQEIFIKVYLHLAEFREKANVTTWIYAITYNYCLDILRQRKKKQAFLPYGIDNEIEIADSVGEYQVKERMLTEMRLALNKLSKEEKAILLMKYEAGKSVKEIAAKMKTSESAMKMRLKRAREHAKWQMQATAQL